MIEVLRRAYIAGLHRGMIIESACVDYNEDEEFRMWLKNIPEEIEGVPV